MAALATLMDKTDKTKPTKRTPTSYQHSDQRGRRCSALPDLNLGKIAEAAGISIGYLSKLLRGIGNPSIPTARKIAEAMGLTLEIFLMQIDGEKSKRKASRAGKLAKPPKTN